MCCTRLFPAERWRNLSQQNHRSLHQLLVVISQCPLALPCLLLQHLSVVVQGHLLVVQVTLQDLDGLGLVYLVPACLDLVKEAYCWLQILLKQGVPSCFCQQPTHMVTTAIPHHRPAQPLFNPCTATFNNTCIGASGVTCKRPDVVLNIPEQNLLLDFLELCFSRA